MSLSANYKSLRKLRLPSNCQPGRLQWQRPEDESQEGYLVAVKKLLKIYEFWSICEQPVRRFYRATFSEDGRVFTSYW